MFNVLSGVYQAAEGQVRFGEHRLDQMRPFQIAGIGVARAFQNIALSPDPVGGREPHARPAPPHQGRVHRRRAAAPAGDPRGQAARRAGRRDRRVPRARRQAADAGRRPLLRRPEAGRGGAGAVHGAATAPARRAGGRHERRGDRPHGRGDPRDPLGARHLRRPGRARHGHGHVARRPGHRARLRTAHRRRHAGRGAGRPRGHPRLPGVGQRGRPRRGRRPTGHHSTETPGAPS